MKEIVEHHVAKLRRAHERPGELEALCRQSVARLYPATPAIPRPVRQEPIPLDAPDWYFEAELRRSGLWTIMERCYPSAHAQSQ
jgi:hypothetical protein